MRRFAIIIPGFIFCLAAMLAGCGGGGSPKNTVAHVTVTPTSISLSSGDVVQVSASAQDVNNGTVTTTFTFNSSNSAIATISPAGQICGGVWDAAFIVCNGVNSAGGPVSGSTTITASAEGVTSNPLPVIVHIKVTSVVVDPVAGCISSTFTQQFTAHACSSVATIHDSSGPCAPNAHEVTGGVGPFNWTTLDAGVATIDTNGLLTAVNSGLTAVFANTTNVSSPPAPSRTCMPIEIRLHIQGQPDESATLVQNQNLTIESDMTDEKGFTKNSIVTIIPSDYPSVVGISNLTLVATSFGGAGIVASCAPPTCGNGFPQPFPVYSNLFPVTVSGTSPATTVYATSSFTPPSGTAPTLVPIDTSKSPPVAGTAITLPGVPNSLIFAADGASAWLGTNAGLVRFAPGSTTATVVDANITGKVLAVAQNGSTVIVSNAAKDPQGNVIQPVGPSQRLWVFNATNSTTQTFVKPSAVAAAIDNDGFRDYIATNDGTGNIYVFSPGFSLQTITIPVPSPPPPPAPSGVVVSDIAALPSDPYVFIADSAGLDAVATCNNVQLNRAGNPPTHSSSIQLVRPVANADVIVAVDSTGIDVETATVKSILSTNPTLPFVLSPANCQPPVSFSNQFLDFGIGPFTAGQLMVATNGSRVVVLPVGNAHVLSAVPGTTPSVAAIPLAGGGTQALSGGMTPDGNNVWAGVAGTNTVDKFDLVGGTDVAQVATSFKKSDGSAAPPDLVAVQPK